MRWIPRRTLLLFGMLGGALGAQGTPPPPRTVAQMTVRATDVVHARCASVASRWTRDGRHILTYVTLVDAVPLKGTTRGEVTFVRLGGRLGNQAMHVVGAPQFRVGEEVVVFLTRLADPHGVYDTEHWLLGLSRGKWSVQRNGTSTRVHSATVHAFDAGRHRSEIACSLEDLIRQVKAASPPEIQAQTPGMEQ